jgi:hypothetical protein
MQTKGKINGTNLSLWRNFKLQVNLQLLLQPLNLHEVISPRPEKRRSKQVRKETSTRPSMSIRSIVDVILKPIYEPPSSWVGNYYSQAEEAGGNLTGSALQHWEFKIHNSTVSSWGLLCFWLLFLAQTPLLMTTWKKHYSNRNWSFRSRSSRITCNRTINL